VGAKSPFPKIESVSGYTEMSTGKRNILVVAIVIIKPGKSLQGAFR
jgi:hypothetical protein